LVNQKCFSVKTTIILLLHLLLFHAHAQQKDQISLLVRSDDMGSTRAANLACIKAVEEGISKTIEVMVPTPWFEEAVTLLSEKEDIDIGVHLVLTSEWDGLKWRPITNVPSLTDPDGYFHPRITRYKHYVSKTYLEDNDWKLEEIEKEFRAQIEMAMKKIKNVTHVTGHMGCHRMAPEVLEMVKKLAHEYGLTVDRVDYPLTNFRPYNNGDSFKVKLNSLLTALKSLENGSHLLVAHPGIDAIEMQGTAHMGYSQVAFERGEETQLLTHKRVKKLIAKLGIKLIGYDDLPQP